MGQGVPVSSSSTKPPRVFLSYSWDDEEHRASVRGFADELRALGIDAWLDQYESYVEHWPSWMVQQCQQADCILVVATARYRDLFERRVDDARGVRFESVLLHNRAYETDAMGQRLGVVVLGAGPVSHVPDLLKGASRAVWPSQRDAVLRLAWGVPEAEPPPIRSALPPVPARSAEASPSHAPGAASREDQRLRRLHVRAEQLRARGEDANEIEVEIGKHKEAGQRQGLRIGDQVGRYELLRKLGQGGFATVWLAKSENDNSEVALKVLHPHWAEDRTRVEQFDRGARRMKDLQHPHVVPVVGEPADLDGYHCFAMRFLPKGDLHGALADLDSRQRAQALADVAAALHHAHEQGMVHRDVKPQNILLDEDGRAYLADFDLVKARDTYAVTRQMGDVFYGAPEVVNEVPGAPPTDRRADVYSFAKVVLFTRDSNVLGHGPAAVVEALRTATLSAAERRVLRKALDENPERRHATVEALWRSFGAAGGETGIRRAALTTVAGALAVLWLWNVWGSVFWSDKPPVDAHAKAEKDLPRWKQLGLKMVEIPSGSFAMGSPPEEQGRGDDESQRRILIPNRFWLATTTVTNRQYRAFVEATGHREPDYWYDSRRNGDDQPVVGVSWGDAQAFCKWAGLRLPSEAEWEYACRAGTTTPFSFGASITPAQVNYDGDYPYASGAKGENRGRTVPVGSLPANRWGLHEMHGNVWQWCEDWYGDYRKAPGDGTAQIKDHGSGRRVVRGGSWMDVARVCRSAFRIASDPSIRERNVGFRPASSSL